jgi:PRTRC genetic system protein C
MQIQTQEMARRFTYNGLSLTDPGPDFTPEEVRDTFAAIYPDIAIAIVETSVEGDVMNYKFVRSVGTKG